MGFDATVINRIPDPNKQSYRASKSLEYIWQQGWMGDPEVAANSEVRLLSDTGRLVGKGYPGIFTHTFAYKLYDIPNTCGPSWDICATFDFERPQSQTITPANIRYAYSYTKQLV